jgi:nitrite reductase/ring-hydroxylating ferredoxin subunit
MIPRTKVIGQDSRSERGKTRMGIFKRIFGICETKPPEDAESWNYSGGRIYVDLNRVPELSAPGSGVRLEGGDLPARILVIHGNDDNFYAYKNTCQHKGRRIDPYPETFSLRCCSVSKATYDYSGKVISGPADGPLEKYLTHEENGTLAILLS